ncbi:ATP-binding protein [Qipengyuania sp. JC766]|uniref:two-component system sensor histidine kinase NtrB n=1 Tax=Qipengyuania sp. JC766 TaxID=3232139 RepID=UPI003459ABE6
MNARSPAPDAQAQIAGLAFGVILIDLAGRIESVNQAGEELLGTSASRLVGKSLGEAIWFEDAIILERVETKLEPLVARGIGLRVGHKALKVNLTVSPLTAYPEWKVLTLSDASRDDWEIAQYDTVAAPAVLAHEIKNPLAAIKGAGQLLARGADADQRALTDLIGNEVARIAGIIDRMQELGSSKPLPLKSVNLHRSVRRALMSVRHRAGTDRVRIVEEFDPSLPKIQANEEALEQALINLLANAYAACEVAEDPQVVVRTRYASGLASLAPGHSRASFLPIEISIVDNGPGVEPSIAGRMFEPFVTSRRGGQGLGLALVRKFVAGMGGAVTHRRDAEREQTIFQIQLARASDDR